MAKNATSEDAINFTLHSLRHDPRLNEDLLEGEFYEKDDWLRNLPTSTQAFICAVQRIGDHPDRPMHCSNIAAEHLNQWKSTKNIDDLDSAIVVYVIALRYTQHDDLRRPDRLSAAAFAYQAKWEQTDSDHDIDTAVHFFRRTVIAAGPNNPVLAALLTNLAYILKRRWSLSKRLEDREEAKMHFAKAIELAFGHPLIPQMLSNYGEFIRLTTSGEHILRVSFLEEAIDLQERALQSLRPGVALQIGTIWRNAAIAYHSLFKITSKEDLSTKTIDHYRQSIALSIPNDHSVHNWQIELAEHYVLRYKKWHRMHDSNEALRIFNAILEVDAKNFAASIGKADVLRMMYDGHKSTTDSRARMLEACQLASSSIEMVSESSLSRGWAYFRTSGIYACYYDLEGDGQLLDRAVELSKLSIKYPKHEAFWDFGRWCGEICQSRHSKTGNSEDLEQAFTAVRSAFELLSMEETESLASCYWVLGKCYASQYKCTERPEDLVEAFGWLQAACVPNSTQKNVLALRQNDLGNLLCLMFHQSFDMKYLDQAIENYAHSISNLEDLPNNYDDFAMLQTGLGQAMTERYQHWGSQDDLRSAIDCFRTSLTRTGTQSARYAGRVCNLCWSLQLMFSLKKNVSLLEEAQSHLITVFNSSRHSEDQVLRLARCHMGNIYLSNYKISKSPSDIDLAIQQYDQMGTDIGVDSHLRAHATMNMAVALNKKALSGHVPSYMDSIAKFDDALRMESKDPSGQFITRANRAGTYRDIYEQLHIDGYGQEALREYSKLAATEHARTDLLLRSADAASFLAVSLNADYKMAYAYIQRATELFPRAVLMFSNRLEQLRLVRKYHYLPSSGTAIAIAAGVEPSQILSNLEQCGGFIWDRFLLSETPLKALREQHEELAHEFDSLRSTLLAQGSPASNTILESAISRKDRLRLERHIHTNTYDKLLERIRQKEGFEDFPYAHVAGDVSMDSNEELPIIYLNFSGYRYDAIIKTSDDIGILALHGLKMEDVTHQAEQLVTAQWLLEGNFLRACRIFEEVMLWLWDTVAKPILDFMWREEEVTATSHPKRILWVCSGWLSFFPIHAAGDWSSDRQSEARPSVQERTISSYIPSMKALNFLRRRSKHLDASIDQGEALLVGMPNTPGMSGDSDLNADVEVASIFSIMDEKIPIQSLVSPLPTSSDVKSAFTNCELAHFACHGCADKADPSKSTLRFADWEQRPFDVRTLFNMKLARCQLVFLSACETAANKDLLLRDEGLHIAGAFNMAGVPHTVAGMWKISDDASVELVNAFYKTLFNDSSNLRYKETATALHTAVDSLRAKGVHPLLWGAFVHMGP